MVKYFSKEYEEVLQGMFKLGFEKIDITVFNNGLIITTPRNQPKSETKSIELKGE